MSKAKSKKQYPRPKEVGGSLIREVIGNLKELRLKNITSHIHCAVSGGLDSVVLAHLLIKYGRNVFNKDGISLLHINHGWRGKDSDQDEVFVKKFAKKMHVPIKVVRLDSKKIKKGDSWEEAARLSRIEIYNELYKKQGSLVFTAHHGDDLAETLLWRLFTGASQTHGAGIFIYEHPQVRPLVSVRKQKLMQYAKEEGLTWREDSTNTEGRFMRSQMRLKLMPEVEEIFPKAVENLIKIGINIQKNSSKNVSVNKMQLGQLLFALTHSRIKKEHFDAIEKIKSVKGARLSLPDGWVLESKNQDEWLLKQVRT